MSAWFAQLEPLISANHYDPALIFNCDEAYLSAGGSKPPRVVTPHGRKPTIRAAKENSEHLTVFPVRLRPPANVLPVTDLLQFISALGELVRPVSVILPLQELPLFADRSLHEFFTFSGQASGWVTREICREVMIRVCNNFSSTRPSRRAHRSSSQQWSPHGHVMAFRALHEHCSSSTATWRMRTALP